MTITAQNPSGSRRGSRTSGDQPADFREESPNADASMNLVDDDIPVEADQQS